MAKPSPYSACPRRWLPGGIKQTANYRYDCCPPWVVSSSRVDQVSALLTAFRDLPPMPSILLGDLNEWRRRGRSSLRGLEPTFGVSPSILSFPSRRPIFPLDRILGWPAGLISGLAVHDTPLARRSSDHLPLTAKVNLRSAILALQLPLETDARLAHFQPKPWQGLFSHHLLKERCQTNGARRHAARPPSCERWSMPREYATRPRQQSVAAQRPDPVQSAGRTSEASV